MMLMEMMKVMTVMMMMMVVMMMMMMMMVMVMMEGVKCPSGLPGILTAQIPTTEKLLQILQIAKYEITNSKLKVFSIGLHDRIFRMTRYLDNFPMSRKIRKVEQRVEQKVEKLPFF